ncbi:ABC transporter permease family protein [Auraticoccus monumenti]|uniref:FtsX-like permease family protein n=1 Tax=Auraticoccus monumenti TaxID=675864 RepID=A0A1G6XS43_9ACTN|nr:FtsX-like permease family protein [Auraticoccus monumenti]SDD80960.1 hypothetical protein SAMN04489747_1789 [Auraticoccus monumenti]
MTRLWWQLTRHQPDHRLTTALSVLAFAVATGALLTVLGGLGAFEGRFSAAPSDHLGSYVLLAQTATVILAVPALTLGAAAARLSMARRNERMAALRLAGATNAQVAQLTLLDTLAQATAGALGGVLLYLLALPFVAMITFQGRTFAWSELWVGPGTLAGTALAVLVLAAGSALLSLVAVTTSPLGVTNRVTPRRLSVLRVVLAVVALLAWTAVSQQPSITAILVVLGICFATLGVVAPFVLGVVGRLTARSARSVETLLAARRLVDDPRGAWRTVAGVSLATFVAGLMSVAPGIGPEDELAVDIATGSVLTLVIAAVLAAVSAGVTQASRAVDQQPVHDRLQMAGTDLVVLRRARLRETLLPLLTSVGLAGGAAVLMVLPFGPELLVSSWAGVATFAGGVVLAVGLVLLAVAATQPLVRPLARDLG